MALAGAAAAAAADQVQWQKHGEPVTAALFGKAGTWAVSADSDSCCTPLAVTGSVELTTAAPPDDAGATTSSSCELQHSESRLSRVQSPEARRLCFKSQFPHSRVRGHRMPGQVPDSRFQGQDLAGRVGRTPQIPVFRFKGGRIGRIPVREGGEGQAQRTRGGESRIRG